jgi:hypothetical protein
MALLLGCMSAHAWALEQAADMAVLYSTEVDRRLVVPAAEVRRYARLAEEALARAQVTLSGPQYLAVVDRDPNTQALFMLFRDSGGQLKLVGASPVSTGRAGTFDNYETPTGVFDHNLANPDFRTDGTPDSDGLRRYGVKGMRVYDFGWQKVPKGWGDGAPTRMRLQVHATDPDLLERRLGSAQSEGSVRIPGTLNRLIDRHGLLDADYLRLGDDHPLWPPNAKREPVPFPGRYLIVVDSQRADRPDWNPAPYIPHRRPAAPTQR